MVNALFSHKNSTARKSASLRLPSGRLAFGRRRNPATEALSRLHELTEREREVLLLPGTGYGNGEFTREPGIAERTVKAHIADMVTRLGQKTRTQAAIVSALTRASWCTGPMHSGHLDRIPGQQPA
ncbi:LuxR C-terminal-related transcriptional regulator [Streptomyces sp. NPDC051133]|uniref:helix-turn-helix domain-containing protein n=1 Tax=Streptomyces sp. NPDC051133 TaxID=3155521 RepID=UPI0034452104